jgi:hypothetical protein
MSPLTESTRLTLAKTYVGIDDTDAAVYVAAVEAADGQSLETATKVAIHSFVKGCKADGIWPAIKSSCILSGARTLAGALIPLAGPAPTNVSNLFVAGDYNRKTGLKGNGTTKYLNTNRTNASDPATNKHLAVYQTESETRDANRAIVGVTSGCELLTTTTSRFFRANNTGNSIAGLTSFVAGTWGIERSSASSISYVYGGVLYTASVAQDTYPLDNVLIFSRSPSPSDMSDGRIAFYSHGTSLSLTALNTRLVALINAFAAAIP